MKIGALPEIIIRSTYNVLKKLFTELFHTIKMKRYYDKARRGQ